MGVDRHWSAVTTVDYVLQKEEAQMNTGEVLVVGLGETMLSMEDMPARPKWLPMRIAGGRTDAALAMAASDLGFGPLSYTVPIALAYTAFNWFTGSATPAATKQRSRRL